MKTITPVAAFIASLVLTGFALAQTGETPAFSISSGDVTEIQLFMGKATMLRIPLSKEKHDEFSKIGGENLQKKVNIVFNGKVVSEMLVTKPEMGKYLDVMMTSPDEAFKAAVAVVNPEKKAATGQIAADPAPVADDVEFSLSSDLHLSKVVVGIARGHTQLGVTFAHDKVEEYARVTRENIGKKLKIVLNGKVVAEMPITQPGWGHSVTVDMPSAEEAFAMAKSLLNPTPIPEAKQPETP